MRKAIIAGNWKMHYTVDEAVKFIEELKPLVKDAASEVVVCPTFVALDAVKKAVRKRCFHWRNSSRNVRSFSYRLRSNRT